MFYLTEFAKIAKQNFLVAIVASFSSLALITVVHYQNDIEKKLTDLGKLKSQQPYFNALVDQKVSFSKIKRKMSQLPGVTMISANGDLNASSEIERLKKTYGGDILESLSQLNYKKIKIEVAQGLKPKSLELIREYLVRLVGKESVTVGEFKFPSLSRSKARLIEVIQIGGVPAMVGLLGFLFFFSVALLAKPLKKHAFIIENFQRKKSVSLHILVKGFGALWISYYAIMYLATNNLNIYSLSLVIGMISVMGLVGLLLNSRRAI